MLIPILWNHDPTKPLGKVFAGGDRLVVEFLPEEKVTREMFEQAFGSCAYKIVGQFHADNDSTIYISKAEILGFALSKTE